MTSQTSALIIARSVQLREGLLVLLRALPQLQRVYEANDGDSALMMGRQINPSLVLLDHDSSQNDMRATLARIKFAWPQARAVVLLDDEQDRRFVEAAGADTVVVKGVLAAKFLEIIEKLLETEVEPRNLA